jgi:hypothetical protein
MSTGKVYKQAIRRAFAKKYHDELMAVYWGREDDAIHVIIAVSTRRILNALVQA